MTKNEKTKVYIGAATAAAIIIYLLLKLKKCENRKCESSGGSSGSSSNGSKVINILPNTSKQEPKPSDQVIPPAVNPPVQQQPEVTDPLKDINPPSKFRAIIDGVYYIFFSEGDKYYKYKADDGINYKVAISLADFKYAYKNYAA